MIDDSQKVTRGPHGELTSSIWSRDTDRVDDVHRGAQMFLDFKEYDCK